MPEMPTKLKNGMWKTHIIYLLCSVVVALLVYVLSAKASVPLDEYNAFKDCLLDRISEMQVDLREVKTDLKWLKENR